MIPLYNDSEFREAKSRDKLTLECKFCKKQFVSDKHYIQKILSGNKRLTLDFCTRKCCFLYKHQENTKSFCCDVCGKNKTIGLHEFNKSKSGKMFCSRSCSAKYNNAHKTTGSRISKLEKWIASELTKIFPKLEIHFNRRDKILSELDIYVPSLNLAFELNGIFHYEKIYGEDKFNRIQNNDNRKIQACVEQNIDFCIIDTSREERFKIEKSKKYLDIIVNIINSKLSGDLPATNELPS